MTEEKPFEEKRKQNEWKQRARDIILIVLFCGFLVSMMAVFYLQPKESFSVEEKRVLAEAPNFSPTAILEGSFEKQAESYVSDHFPGRKFFVGLDAYYALYTGRNGSNGIYKADEGYLINKPVVWDTENFTKNVTHIRDFVDDTGLPAVMLLVPSAGYIEEALLPWNHDVYPDGEILKEVQSILEGSNLLWIDLSPLFKEAVLRRIQEQKDAAEGKKTQEETFSKETEEAYPISPYIYYKTDHHWTSLGAYLAYCRAAEAMGIVPIERMAFSISRYDGFYGTTYAKSALWGTSPDQVEVWKYPSPVTVEIMDDSSQETITSNSMFFWNRLTEPDMYQVFLDGNHSLVKIQNHSLEEGKKLLVIKDSYGHAITPFFANHYGEIYMVDLRYYRKQAVSDLIRSQGIDEILVVYSVDNMVNDTNISWLR